MTETQLNIAVAKYHRSRSRLLRQKVNEAFMQGLSIALGALIRDHDQPSMAIDIMRCNGLTLKDLEGCGVEAFDLKPIRKAWRQK